MGFDNHPAARDQLLTSLHLPHDELGRAAGDLLWEKHNANARQTPQQRIVQMRLIPRLTCQPDWAQHTIHDAPLLAPQRGETRELLTGELATT